ncbi:MAG: YaiI/YqxD family protein [Oligoflexia bacterium]|nr:YaiI/YqxD family protein [Oligoflexia bacterium]
MKSETKIWIDADACPRPVKDFIFDASVRLNVPVILVANSHMFMPRSSLFSLIVVGKGLDEADKYIIDNASAHDLVITADIPLASLLVDKGVLVLNPRGDTYTDENVKDVLATRNLMQDLRDGGLIVGGPAPFSLKDKINFTNAFDREITKLLKKNFGQNLDKAQCK